MKTTDSAYAVRLAAEVRRSREHLAPTADRTTLAALCELYRPRFAHLKEHTRETKERILTRIKHHWPTRANTTLNKIRPSECEHWLASVTANRSASTRNDHVWLLKDMFGMAVDDRLLISSPAAKLKAIRREDPLRPTPAFQPFETIIATVRAQ